MNRVYDLVHLVSVEICTLFVTFCSSFLGCLEVGVNLEEKLVVGSNDRLHSALTFELDISHVMRLDPDSLH